MNMTACRYISCVVRIVLSIECAALFVASCTLAQSTLHLRHSFPFFTESNFSRVSLRCTANRQSPIALQDARFYFGEREITEDSVLGYERRGEEVTYTITQGTDGALTCRHDGETSAEVRLAGKS